MSSEMPKSDQIREDNGSRDATRKFLKEAQRFLALASEQSQLAAEEIGKLLEHNKYDVAYRYADADVGISIANIQVSYANLEKVRIVMRKRKRTEKKIEASPSDGNVPDAPIGD